MVFSIYSCSDSVSIKILPIFAPKYKAAPAIYAKGGIGKSFIAAAVDYKISQVACILFANCLGSSLSMSLKALQPYTKSNIAVPNCLALSPPTLLNPFIAPSKTIPNLSLTSFCASIQS